MRSAGGCLPLDALRSVLCVERALGSRVMRAGSHDAALAAAGPVADE